MSISDAGREAVEIDHELAALERHMDAQHAALEIADIAAQARILESVMPEYRQLANEAARQAFLVDLRRRGVFQEPPIVERG